MKMNFVIHRINTERSNNGDPTQCALYLAPREVLLHTSGEPPYIRVFHKYRSLTIMPILASEALLC